MKNNKIVITKYKDFNAAFLFKDGNIDELIISKEKAFNVGAIYIGRVSMIKNDLKACFVEFTEGSTGYISFEDIYPECLLSREYDGRLIQGDLVCVQVTKDPVKTKGATLSMRLTITGGLSVMTLDDPGIHISSKLNKDFKREADAFFKGKSFGFGFILRTNSAGASFSEIEAEIVKNAEVLKSITSVMKFRDAFTCLYKADSSFIQRIRNIATSRYDEALTDDKEMFEVLTDLKNLRLYDDVSMPLKALYSFDKAFDLATARKVDFKHGGYLCIEPTEALTVIDVNSGKFTGNISKEEAIHKINLEAAREIARQLRLRNISGIIIVDFINESDESYLSELKSTLYQEFKKDNLKAVMVDFTPLGLAEITREKRYGSIYDELKN